MEAILEKGNSAKRYNYCSFCHLNHKKWKKHVYSKRHQEIMQKILEKFSNKVKGARDSINLPGVEEPSFEREAKVWCYFCSEDVDKHTHFEMYTLLFGAFIDHLSSDNHLVMTNKFLHSNLLDKNKLNDLVFDAVALKSFMENASKAVTDLEKRKHIQLSRDAAKIRGVDERRHQFVQKWRCESEDQMKCSSASSRRVHSSTIRKRKVIMASGEGVTSILQPNAAPDDGNIFSGALPPWLRPDTETQSSSQIIGPTMEDFQKHLEKEKKGKLPANRVGANFDHTSATSQEWLPSFGRVWSKGRRLQSKNFFEKQTRPGKNKIYSVNPRTIDSDELSSPSVLSQSVKPYQKKRASATVSDPRTANSASSTASPAGINLATPMDSAYSQDLLPNNANVDTYPKPNTNSSVKNRDPRHVSKVYASTVNQPYNQGSQVHNSNQRSSSWLLENKTKTDFKGKQTSPLHVPYKRKRIV